MFTSIKLIRNDTRNASVFPFVALVYFFYCKPNMLCGLLQFKILEDNFICQFDFGIYIVIQIFYGEYF